MTSTDPHPHAHSHGADDDPLHNADVAHEDTDVDVATVLKFGAGLFVTVVACAIIVRIIFGVLDRQATARDPQVSPLALPAGQLPPGPRLVLREPVELAKFRAEETATIEGYGWVDQTGGVTRIPVEEAKKLLVQRGVPARTTGAAGAALGTHHQAYGESSGGRTIK